MPFKLEELLFKGLAVAEEGSRLLNGNSAYDRNGNPLTPSQIMTGGHNSAFGVHIVYQSLYAAVIFFTVIWAMGYVSQRYLKMPSLVGEIFAGIILGPPLFNFVPVPVAFVMLGEIGLILLVLEAGVDVDLTTLKMIGSRGFLIAIVGSVLPIAFGLAIAFALGYDTKTSIAAGACFGPTSLGIAMNILRQGKLVNTPVGQLVISAAVIDDMIALIILSQLSALVGPVQIAQLIIPIVSALLFLGLGGYLAVAYAPQFFNWLIVKRVSKENKGATELTIMMGLLLGLMPATFYAQASFLMGAFIAGLCFCRSQELHHIFVRQFKRLLQWLMRVFFAASIGFQVPLTSFGNGKVIWQGVVFTLALLGKILVGFMVPNFSQVHKYTETHLRDCLITGFSMAAEGEFAFVIAVFAVDSQIITVELYASIVLAVLFSTIAPPFLLRFTISYYTKRAQDKINAAAEEELTRSRHRLGLRLGPNGECLDGKALEEGLKNETTVFLCIQTQSATSWGLLGKMMETMQKLKLEMIDHRSWHPPGDDTLVNEVFVKDMVMDATAIKARMDEIGQAMSNTIKQRSAKVKVSRWYPGVLQEIKEVDEEVCTDHHVEKRMNQNQTRNGPKKSKSYAELTTAIMEEATQELRRRQSSGSLNSLGDTEPESVPSESGARDAVDDNVVIRQKKRHKKFIQKTHSTPVAGGDLFEQKDSSLERAPSITDLKNMAEEMSGKVVEGRLCTLNVDGDTFKVRISHGTINRIRTGYGSNYIENDNVTVNPDDVPVTNRLEGFVRNQDTLGTVTEEKVVYNEYTYDGKERGERDPKKLQASGAEKYLSTMKEGDDSNRTGSYGTAMAGGIGKASQHGGMSGLSHHGGIKMGRNKSNHSDDDVPTF